MTVSTARPESPGIKSLRARFRGALLQPGDEGYDSARRVWNGAIDRKPALIARCTGTDDVVEAIRFARQHDLAVSVRGGGHSVAGHAVCDDGLMIDLSLMNAVQVDPAARTARAGGGALLSDLDRATQRFGLATTAGVVSHTGIGGLTLGGGLGHLMRKHGLTVDNLLSADLVTADGQRLHVDAQTEPELFWGLRGGGGNFGIVTSFEYRLHQVGPMVLGGPIFWPLDDAPEVLRFVNNYAREAPDELGITITMRLAPPMLFVPPEHHMKPMVGLLLLWSGNPAEGQQAIAPLRQIGTPFVDLVQPAPYLAFQTMLDLGNPHGMHYYWRSLRVPDLTDKAINALVRIVENIPTPFSYIAAFAMGGAASRVAPEATAVGSREIGFEVNTVAAWSGSDPNGEQHKTRVRQGWEELRPLSTGVYANFLSDEGRGGIEYAYGARLKRLSALKERYDPDNVFRFNANIAPGH